MVNSIKICHICPLDHRPVLNYTRFRENILIPQLGSKFRIPRKTVVPTDLLIPSYRLQHWW